ncbi:MAG: mechanosensitive ion channel [Desulfovibrionaceae bacterium]|nr:mechanosensitive ion channel [Desulfovibrionaceae bacterium]
MPRQLVAFFLLMTLALLELTLTLKDVSAEPEPHGAEEAVNKPQPATPLLDPKTNSSPKEDTIFKISEPTLEDIVNKADQTIIQVHKELVEKKLQAEPWKERWNEARSSIKKTKTRAEKLAEAFDSRRDLLLSLEDHERDFSQILPMVSTYKDWASPTESVQSRLNLMLKDIDREYAHLREIYDQEKKLHSSVVDRSSFSVNINNETPEFKSYLKDLKETEEFIAKSLEMHAQDLKPVDGLKERINQILNDIESRLPKLWKDYYLRPPLTWLDPNVWKYLPRQLDIAARSLELRKSLVFPSDTNEWRKAILRAVIGAILLFTILLVVSRQSFVPMDTNPVVRHCFKVSLPIICLGLCFLLSAISPQGSTFFFFLSIGNLIIIAGQMLLAWDLRLLSSPDIPRQASPLLRFLPLTYIAYILIYLPLLQPLLLLLWLISLIGILIWRHFWPELNIGNLTLEKNIRTFDGLILWICLILTLIGLHMYSLILYLVSVSTSLALELCQAGIDRINYLNENQPSQGITAILSGILVSLAAPIIMVMAVLSVLLWIATLPGGMILTKEYLFKNVSIGSAEFNFIHILIIISAFFLTKAIVSTGIRYIERVISNPHTSVDTTLVTPAQTAFTYITWIIFTFFVLHVLDIDLKNAAMVATGLSVGIGMGLQGIVQNFFSGLLLIFGRMLQVGDVIEVGGVSGKVVKISVRDTLVQTFDNAFIYVPNSEFIAGHLINWSRNDSTVRASVSVGVAYGSDTGLVIKTLQTLVNKHHMILRYPEPTVTFTDFADSTLNFSVYFWVNQFTDRVKTCSEIRLQIEKEFKAKHIEIAFPQMDVHLQKDLVKRELSPKVKEKRKSRIMARKRSVHLKKLNPA